jgi:tRNA threonylcarbamoyl adenosine modification protein YjeE
MPPKVSLWPTTIELADEAATERLARLIAAVLAPGDTIALSGGLGSGKTTLARALIRSVAGDPELEVPSPTFTLVQTYSESWFPVAHFDLYRLRDAGELAELGLEDAASDGALLVEWPERAGSLPGSILRVALSIEPGGGRLAALSGSAAWETRLGRLLPMPG